MRQVALIYVELVNIINAKIYSEKTEVELRSCFKGINANNFRILALAISVHIEGDGYEDSRLERGGRNINFKSWTNVYPPGRSRVTRKGGNTKTSQGP